MAEDVSESRDLAAELPDKVAELVALWWEEARRNDVLPLDNRVLEAMAHKHDRRRPQTPTDTSRAGPGSRVGGRQRAKPIPRDTVDLEVPDGAVPPGSCWRSVRHSAAGPSM